MKIYTVDNLSPMEKLLVQAYWNGMRDGSNHKAEPIEWLRENTEAIQAVFREELSARRNQFSKHPILPIIDDDYLFSHPNPKQ